MATNSNVYYPTSLEQCSLDMKYISSFGDIVIKDYPGKSFGFDDRILDAKCIDADRVETDRAGRNEKTMDLVMGISDFNDVSRKYTRQNLLPIELKLNCIAFNLKLADLREKDEHTRNTIPGTFSRNSVFIFTEKVAGLAINHYNRWKHGTGSNSIKNWVIVNPLQFNALIKFDTDFPYVQQTKFNDIAETIDGFIEKHDIDGCYDYIATDVLNIVESFGVKVFNKDEVAFLSDKLKDKIEKVFTVLDEDEIEYLTIALDKILNFAKTL